MRFIQAALLSALLAISIGCKNKPEIIAPQQKVEHLVAFLDDDDNSKVYCTATAIGPAAFMTATHCNDGKEPSHHVRFDMSVKVYELLAVSTDDRDHAIWLLTESPFVNVADVLINPKPATSGESVYIYGCGGRQQPCLLKSGKQIYRDVISDVDQTDAFVHYSVPVIQGDSGSALFGSDGRIIALITYGYEDEGTGHLSCGAFDLNFTESQISVAKNFNPDMFR